MVIRAYSYSFYFSVLLAGYGTKGGRAVLRRVFKSPSSC